MKQRRRIYYTETDKALMWDRWEEGESLNSIARLFDRHHSAIQGILSRTGGIRPPQRTRSQRALTLAEVKEEARRLTIKDIPEAADWPEWYWDKNLTLYLARLRVMTFHFQDLPDLLIKDKYEWKYVIENSYPTYEDLPYMSKEDHKLSETFYKCVLTTDQTAGCIEAMFYQ